MNEVVGFVMIKHDAKVVTAGDLKDFQGQSVRVVEFASDGSALVVNFQGTALGMVKKEDIKSSFRCSIVSNLVICPPDLNFFEQMAYMTKSIMRKGGYNGIVQQMVVLNSLRKGVFDDNFLYVVQ